MLHPIIFKIDTDTLELLVEYTQKIEQYFPEIEKVPELSELLQSKHEKLLMVFIAE